MSCWKPSTSTLTRSSRTSRPPDARRRASGGRTPIEDALHYLPTLLEKRGVAAAPALAVLERLSGIVHVVSEETYSPLRRTALARIEQRDPHDWPILATAIVLQCPIWTEDQDFFGTGVPTWTTDRIEIYLSTDA